MLDLIGRTTHDTILQTFRGHKNRLALKTQDILDEHDIPLRSVAEYIQYTSFQISWCIRNPEQTSLRKLLKIYTMVETISFHLNNGAPVPEDFALDEVLYVVYPFNINPAFGKELRYSPSDLCDLYGINPRQAVSINSATKEQKEIGIHLRPYVQ